MSKKRNGNSFWSNGPDSELIARFTGFLKQVLLNERSTYLKNLKKKELNECSFEELEEKGQFQKQFAVDEVENILMWEAIRNYISLLYTHGVLSAFCDAVDATQPWIVWDFSYCNLKMVQG